MVPSLPKVQKSLIKHRMMFEAEIEAFIQVYYELLKSLLHFGIAGKVSSFIIFHPCCNLSSSVCRCLFSVAVS